MNYTQALEIAQYWHQYPFEGRVKTNQTRHAEAMLAALTDYQLGQMLQIEAQVRSTTNRPRRLALRAHQAQLLRKWRIPRRRVGLSQKHCRPQAAAQRRQPQRPRHPNPAPSQRQTRRHRAQTKAAKARGCVIINHPKTQTPLLRGAGVCHRRKHLLNSILSTLKPL